MILSEETLKYQAACYCPSPLIYTGYDSIVITSWLLHTYIFIFRIIYK